jgi:hypothetical protein
VASSNNFQSSPAYAECIADSDWPDRPCYDSSSPSNDEIRQAWAKYYEYKGAKWMDMKKAELDQALRNGTLREWALYQSEPNNSANYNVYYYYFLNGQAPPLNSEAAGKDPTIVSTRWEITPVGWAIVAGVGLSSVAAIVAIFRKARRLQSQNK